MFEESTNVIVNEVNSLKGMVDEFSKYARMPAPQMARQSLHDAIHDVVALYRGAHRDVEFLCRLDEDVPQLKFDREQMKRVFVNLFDNAVQAMNQKGHLWVTTQYDTKRRRAVVSMADEGRDRARRPGEAVRALFHEEEDGDRPGAGDCPAHHHGS